MKAILVFFIGSLLAASYVAYDLGQDSQKAKDQVIFDQVNADLAKQKKEAASLLNSLQQKIIDAQAESAKFKHQLEKQRAQHNETVTALRTEYATSGLFFNPPQSAGCGSSGGSTEGPKGGSPSTCPTTHVQLPEPLATRIRSR
jgi:hypothetical protein